MEYVAFEVDRANIGRGRRGGEDERTAGALCIRWNRVFVKQGVPLRICPAYRHTGNYWIYSEERLALADMMRLVSDSIHREFAALTTEEFLVWLASLKAAMKEPTQTAAGRRPTPGAVMDLNSTGPTPPSPPPSWGQVATEMKRHWGEAGRLGRCPPSMALPMP